MTNEHPNDSREDINEQVASDWVDETTVFERVYTVMKRTYSPQSATEIADRAQTTPPTARKHLDQLVENGFVTEVHTSEHNATLYKRSPQSVVLEQAASIRREIDRETLLSRINEMQSQIEAYQEQYGALSPSDAVIDESNIDREALQDWQTTFRNLKLARAALVLDEAEDAVEVA